MQYTKIDIYNSQVAEEEDIVKSSNHFTSCDQGHVNGDEEEEAEEEGEDSLFDDPKYILSMEI